MEASVKEIANATQEIVVECGLSKDAENVAKIRTVHLAQIASRCFSFFLIEIQKDVQIVDRRILIIF